jgi:hypothetical protein
MQFSRCFPFFSSNLSEIEQQAKERFEASERIQQRTKQETDTKGKGMRSAQRTGDEGRRGRHTLALIVKDGRVCTENELLLLLLLRNDGEAPGKTKTKTKTKTQEISLKIIYQ